jgi:plastocyanin
VTRFDQDDTSTTGPRIWGSRLRRLGLGTAGVLSVAALAACSSSSSPTQQQPSTSASSGATGSTNQTAPASSPTASAAAGSSQPAAQPAVITISKFAYAVPESVPPGTMITVVNKDEEAHTVTADAGGAFDDKATPGANTQLKAPTKPGSYPFHCTYHSNMHGVLVVK